MRSVVYIYHSKIQTEKQTTVSLKGVGTCCGNWWEDRPKHQDSFMEELHFLIQVYNSLANGSLHMRGTIISACAFFDTSMFLRRWCLRSFLVVVI